GNDADLLRLRALLALRDLELHALTVLKGLVPVHLDRGEVDEHVLPPVDRDEAVALLAVEPLHGALCHGALPHFDVLGLPTPDPTAEPVPLEASALSARTKAAHSDRTRTLHEVPPATHPRKSDTGVIRGAHPRLGYPGSGQSAGPVGVFTVDNVRVRRVTGADGARMRAIR